MGALLAIPLVRFVTYPLRKGATDTTWSDVGPVQDFASLTAPDRENHYAGTSRCMADHFIPDRGIRVAAKAGQFRILSPICPHLGCSVRWVDDQSKFVCPCHSGSFTATESVLQDHRLAPWTHLNPKSRTEC